MGLFGLFKKYDLNKIKREDIAREVDELKTLEQQRMRRLADLQDNAEGVRLYAKQERLTEAEMEQCAGQIEDLEFDVAATEQELNNIRREKQALGGLVKLQAQRERLQKSEVWDTINKMDPEKLEEGLRNLGALDKQTSDNMDKLRETLGIPTTRRDTRSAWTPRRRQILEELKSGTKGQFDQA